MVGERVPSGFSGTSCSAVSAYHGVSETEAPALVQAEDLRTWGQRDVG